MNPIFYGKFSLKTVAQAIQRGKKSLFRNGVWELDNIFKRINGTPVLRHVLQLIKHSSMI